MSQETPFPSAEVLFDVAPLVIGRVGQAQREIVRRLSIALPPLTQQFNSDEGLTDTAALPVPKAKDVLIAPNRLTDGHVGKILVGMSVQFRDAGPGAFQKNVSLVVSSIDGRLESGKQVTVLWERVELVVLALFPYLTGCRDAQGRKVWRQLIPTGMSLLEGDWAKDYSGTRATFLLLQTPNMDVD